MELIRREETLSLKMHVATGRLLLAERQAAAEEARALLATARAQAEAERERVLEEARAQARAEAQRASAEAERMVARAAVWSAARRARWAECLAVVVGEACRAILREEVASRPEIVAGRCRALLEQNLLREPSVIRLHPADAARIGTALARETGGQVRVEPSPDVPAGGCRLLGDEGEIDATLEVELEGLMDAVREGLHEDIERE